MDEPRFLLVDGHGLAFRAFYALPELSAPDGTPVHAILGFLNMLQKVLEEQRPQGWGLFFDPKGETERKKIYGDYKLGRRPTPEGFKIQLPLLLELLEALGHRVHVREGVEADDLIASTALSLGKGREALVLSADKDLLQVLSPGVRVMRPQKGVSEFRLFDEALFREEYGFAPSAMADYLALTGDAVDHIPGVAGIGDKGARALVSHHGSLEGIYAHLGELPKGQRGKLEEGREQAFASRALVVPLPTEAIPAEGLIPAPRDDERARTLCSRLGLKQLLKRLGLGQEGTSPGQGTGAPAASVVRKGAPVSLEEVLAAPRLAVLWERKGDSPVHPRMGEVALVLPDGRNWRGELPEGFPLGERLRGKRCLFWGYKEWCALEGREGEPEEGVEDLKLVHYALHPDRGESAGRGLPPGTENPFALLETLCEEPLWPSVAPLVRDLDLPLAPVLARMESRGIGVDEGALASLDVRLEGRSRELEALVRAEAGEEVNLQSPKQMAALLFERLGLPPLKKTKTGFSTDVGVLEELAKLPDPLSRVPRHLLEHREVAKLRTGFVQPFLKQAHRDGGHIYSTFEQTATGTGRLSSRDPNVQNLPVFGEWAEAFRRCLVPTSPKDRFLSADYSQIELRVLAHLCGEPRLVQAFEAGRDIHRETASWVYGVAAEEVSAEQRRFAKVVNFGLLYGMSAHGLAQRMGVGRPEAAQIIDRYFSVLPRVREYLEETVREAKARGYTVSLFGRVRPLGEVSTVEGRGGGALDRVAVNSPIQSTAADIAKVAMVDLERRLRGSGLPVRLVLQVHDSLVCQVPQEALEEAASLLRDVMERAVTLSVPLETVTKAGSSLADL